MTGIEIDAETVLLGRKRHPEVAIVEGDLQAAAAVLAGPFDLVYAMTALYAVPDQPAAFAQLRRLAARGAELRLLEYSDPHGRFAAATRGHPSREWWRPLEPGALPGALAAAGWTLIELRDLEPELTRWYEVLCRRIAARKDAIEMRVRRRLVRVRGRRVRRHPRERAQRCARRRAGACRSRGACGLRPRGAG